jgi:hypothetical protein
MIEKVYPEMKSKNSSGFVFFDLLMEEVKKENEEMYKFFRLKYKSTSVCQECSIHSGSFRHVYEKEESVLKWVISGNSVEETFAKNFGVDMVLCQICQVQNTFFLLNNQLFLD